jgi:hypothetical protein
MNGRDYSKIQNEGFPLARRERPEPDVSHVVTVIRFIRVSMELL